MASDEPLLIVGLSMVAAGLVLMSLSRESFSVGELKSELRDVKSTTDGRIYKVKSGIGNEQQACELMANVHMKLMSIVDGLRADLPQFIPMAKHKGVSLLLERARGGFNLIELDGEKHKSVAFNKNKGQYIFLCLRKDASGKQLASINAVLYVAIHEVAHLMQSEYEPLHNGSTVHGPVFKENERFLMESAKKHIGFNYKTVPGDVLCSMPLPQL